MTNGSDVQNKRGLNDFFWDEKAKKPTKYTFILLISITFILLILGIVDSLSSIHEIKVEIDYSDDFAGEIDFQDTYNNINDNMGNEYTYEIREGVDIWVNVYKYGTLETLTVRIYDNGELVRERSTNEQWGGVDLDYTVGE